MADEEPVAEVLTVEELVRLGVSPRLAKRALNRAEHNNKLWEMWRKLRRIAHKLRKTKKNNT